MNHILKRYLPGLSLAILLGFGPLGNVNATAVEYVGQVDEVSIPQRVIVIDGAVYRLGSPINFTSDFPGTDLVTGVQPGAYVTFNGDPDRPERAITRIHVHKVVPE